MAHRIVHPVKHAGKIHKPGAVVSWPDAVTGDLVKLGALVLSDSALATESEKQPENPVDPKQQPSSGTPAAPVAALGAGAQIHTGALVPQGSASATKPEKPADPKPPATPVEPKKPVKSRTPNKK